MENCTTSRMVFFLSNDHAVINNCRITTKQQQKKKNEFRTKHIYSYRMTLTHVFL